MTAGPGAPGVQGAPPAFTDEEMAWMEAHLSELRDAWSGERFRYRILGCAIVVGLAADVGGYLLRAAAATEFIGLLGDLLYTLGWGLWTGAVVVVLLQLYPEAKRRQVQQALDAYEAALRAKARTGRGQTASDDGAPPAHE